MTKQVDIAQLKAFSPIDSLKKDNLAALVKKTKVRDAQPGEALFREGDAEKRTVYILSGRSSCAKARRRPSKITGGTDDARNPLSPKLPRRHTAIAVSGVEYITIDSDLLDVMLTWDQTGSYEVSELRGETGSGDDWMTTLLQTKAFHKIPPANIQAIFMRLQQVNYKAGDVVIKQGDEGDYFYVITRGKCVVTRETPLNKEGIRLAELQVGDTFGEEALISEAKRNATVAMETDGSLMRLGKEDFRKLLNEPMLDWVDAAGRREGHPGRRSVARRSAAVRVRGVPQRGRDQRSALLHPAEAQDAGLGGEVRRLLRHGPAQLGRRVHPERARIPNVRIEGRPQPHRSARLAVRACASACPRRARRRDSSRCASACCPGLAR